jgi:mannose/fructose/N-acetylgalactosamine-specific phosphotransferase system component IIC
VINWHENICFGVLGITLPFLAEMCCVVAQQEYIAAVETDDSEEISDLWLLSLILNILLCVVWCHVSLCFMLIFQAPIQDKCDLFRA